MRNYCATVYQKTLIYGRFNENPSPPSATDLRNPIGTSFTSGGAPNAQVARPIARRHENFGETGGARGKFSHADAARGYVHWRVEPREPARGRLHRPAGRDAVFHARRVPLFSRHDSRRQRRGVDMEAAVPNGVRYVDR